MGRCAGVAFAICLTRVFVRVCVPLPFSENVSLIDVATPPDSHTAINRLRILSEKFGVDPDSVPASLEAHLQWVREQDELDRQKEALQKQRRHATLSEAHMALYQRAMTGGPDDQIVTESYVNETLQMDLMVWLCFTRVMACEV